MRFDWSVANPYHTYTMPFPGISQLWLHIQTWQHMAISVFLNDNLNYFGIEQMLCLLTNHICHYHHECDKHILDITICPLHRPLTLRVSRVIMDHPLAVTFLLTFLLTFMNIRLKKIEDIASDVCILFVDFFGHGHVATRARLTTSYVSSRLT